jgi:hypothetical protein
MDVYTITYKIYKNLRQEVSIVSRTYESLF